jgi:hypothetical protein
MSQNPNPIDLDRLLRFFRQVYAHSMTLEQLILLPESERTEEKYNALRKENDRTVEQDFDLLFRAVHDSTGFSAAVQAFLDNHPPSGRVQ